MNILRWILGVIGGLLGGGLLALGIFSNGFRRSFGASANSLWLVALPIIALGLLVAALCWPLNRILLHVAAIGAAGLAAFCIWQMISESATVLAFGLIYLGFWFVFYGSKVW